MLQTNILVVVFSFLDTHNLLKCSTICKRFQSIIKRTIWNVPVEVIDASRYMFFYINYKFVNISIVDIKSDIRKCFEYSFIKISHLIKDIFIDRRFEEYRELTMLLKDILYKSDNTYVILLPESIRENIKTIRELYYKELNNAKLSFTTTLDSVLDSYTGKFYSLAKPINTNIFEHRTCNRK